jgi:hypothetical protein
MQPPPALRDRRFVLAAGLALPGAALAAKLAPPDAEVNATAIRWPVGPVRELHGYMAIPAKARGRQPAVLVIGGRDTPDLFARQIVRSAAQAGFVACTANAATIMADTLADDMRATALWLAKGRYGTGRVGAVGLDGGAGAALALAGAGTLSAAILFGGAAPSPPGAPVLSFGRSETGWRLLTESGASATFDGDWAAAWSRAMAYLREKLT